MSSGNNETGVLISPATNTPKPETQGFKPQCIPLLC